MTTIAGTGVWDSKGVFVQTYDAMGDDDVGTTFPAANLPDKTVHVKGTFDSAVATIQGSNDELTWVTLVDPQGNALTFSAEGMETIMENPLFMRPTTSGGAGSTDLNVIFVGESARR